MLAIILIMTGVFFRFIPHMPNINPVAAIALFGAAYLPNKRLALIVPLALMILSDLFLGLHDIVIFTWGSVVLISLIGLSLKRSKKITNILAGSLISSLVFFIVTNFGVWASGWYPLTLSGLSTCYIAGIPFFRNFLASTLVYSAALFGAYELSAKFIRNTKFAAVLLTR
ncbi:MAG: hypothetical protein COX96_06970 [Candidatus Omnitrophica bacterium CG_4_10_14_0_2_um_filter_44_9]|nr:MAG: hypothetical protein COY78_03155 [Candidatus Omnitrophica bacterium CG_4_10_14_0_8_um_filter_44_12]PIZ83717.1 MAG: hypothetical protein COX96_06970 [Candidatus Omnitrophica bacterium CG_4_10_14_0_2_um_filter_44_9]